MKKTGKEEGEEEDMEEEWNSKNEVKENEKEGLRVRLGWRFDRFNDGLSASCWKEVEGARLWMGIPVDV